jgi:periplasmic copper chaperone A
MRLEHGVISIFRSYRAKSRYPSLALALTVSRLRSTRTGFKRGYAVSALIPFALLASCSGPAQVYVDNVVVKLSPVDSNPSAMYFTVHGGAKDVYLEEVVSPSVIRSEMHNSGMDAKTGMMTMEPIDRIKVPANGKLIFKQGGKHVMVWGVNLVARKLGEIKTQFIFSNGDRIEVEGVVQEMDGSVPDEKKAIS